MKILFAVAECLPFIKTGGLADVAGALPRLLAARGHEVRVIMPGFGKIDRERFGFTPGDPFTVNHMGSDVELGLMESGFVPGVKTALVLSESLYGRENLYGEPDDQHRFTIFCKACMAYMFNRGWFPDIVHCHDWHTALLPVFLRTAAEYDPVWRKTRSVFTIHNLGYQGVFPREAVRDAGLDESLFSPDCMEHWGQANFMKGAIVFADKITTVSPAYAKEILTPEFGEGLEGILGTREKDITGIINGIDYGAWGPERDMAIAARYSRLRPAGKEVCKKELLRSLGLDPERKGPVFGIVSRLCRQKGIDALIEPMRDLLSHSDSAFIVQGTGDKEYEDMTAALCSAFPEQARHIARYSEASARRVYAGSDVFLMPSRYEPCGLSQMIALAYGTIPFVHKTGGLSDTVFDVDGGSGKPNGFVFEPLGEDAVRENLWRAYFKYKNSPEEWQALRDSAFACRYTWD
ncbi:MAG: glycogen synthase, partial [Abditibacteriota bacterium]|nr:glycogen synthase [Abditibacteriota bacterium]